MRSRPTSPARTFVGAARVGAHPDAGTGHHVLRRQIPPTSHSAPDTCPSEAAFTVSIIPQIQHASGCVLPTEIYVEKTPMKDCILNSRTPS